MGRAELALVESSLHRDDLLGPKRLKLSVRCVCLLRVLLRVWGTRFWVSSSNETLLASRSCTPVRFVSSFFFNVWTGDSTSFISSAKRLLNNTSLLMGAGLKSESEDVAGGWISGRGSRVRYMGGLSQWLLSLWLVVTHDWSRADWDWSGLESGWPGLESHWAEPARRSPAWGWQETGSGWSAATADQLKKSSSCRGEPDSDRWRAVSGWQRAVAGWRRAVSGCRESVSGWRRAVSGWRGEVSGWWGAGTASREGSVVDKRQTRAALGQSLTANSLWLTRSKLGMTRGGPLLTRGVWRSRVARVSLGMARGGLWLKREGIVLTSAGVCLEMVRGCLRLSDVAGGMGDWTSLTRRLGGQECGVEWVWRRQWVVVVVPSVVGGWSQVLFLSPLYRERRECARVVGGRDMLSGGSLCVLSAGAVGSAGWGSPVAWRGSVVVVKPYISEVSSSACTPFLSKHRALSPGQVGSHTKIEGVCQLLSTVSLLQYGELVLPSVQSCYDGAGTVVVVVLGLCAVCTLNVVCSPGFAARIKAVLELNHLSDTSCVLFVRAFVNVEKKRMLFLRKNGSNLSISLSMFRQIFTKWSFRSYKFAHWPSNRLLVLLES